MMEARLLRTLVSVGIAVILLVPTVYGARNRDFVDVSKTVFDTPEKVSKNSFAASEPVFTQLQKRINRNETIENQMIFTVTNLDLWEASENMKVWDFSQGNELFNPDIRKTTEIDNIIDHSIQPTVVPERKRSIDVPEWQAPIS